MLYKNRELKEWGIDMGIEKKDLKKIDNSSDVIKFEKTGQKVKGFYISLTESKKYPNSYGLKFKDTDDEKTKIVFINNVGKELFDNMEIGKIFLLEYTGKAKTKDGNYEYNTYELYSE